MEAELIFGLCQQFGGMPERGAVMDQPVWVLRMQSILRAAGEAGT